MLLRTLICVLLAQTCSSCNRDIAHPAVRQRDAITLEWMPHAKDVLRVNPRKLCIAYGNCTITALRHADEILSCNKTAGALPHQIVWGHAGKNDQGLRKCVMAYLDEVLVGRTRIINRGSRMQDLDTTGLWFKDVEKAIPPAVVSHMEKQTRVAIVGAGISGLMTSLLLDSVGLHNYSIIEASSRIGGKIETEYFGLDKEQYVYQEMGPMRFPHRLYDPRTNKTRSFTDQQLVYLLAEELNNINTNNANLSVNFIPWYQKAPGNLVYIRGLKLDTGLPPNSAQMRTMPSAPSRAEQAIANLTKSAALRASVASNVFRAHHDWVISHYDDFDKFGYLHNHLHFSLDVTDQLTAGALGASTDLWNSIFEGAGYFSNYTVEWLTIDRGLSQLSNAFWGTRAADRITTGRKIWKIDNEGAGRVRVHWKPNDTASVRDSLSETYDYAIVAVPFSVTKYWRLPNISEPMSRAMKNLKFSNACKVALKFSSRFWERAPFDPPILGGCSVTDLPGIRTVCYPSYEIGRKGPAALLAQYAFQDDGDRLLSWPEDHHIQYVIDAMAEMHGDVVYDEYMSGSRKCWGLDPFHASAWSSPLAGQVELYMPEYYKTHNRTIFIGEHTSVTNGWISSALESAVRGTVQLLLELGLVNEAKQITEKWMGRWLAN